MDINFNPNAGFGKLLRKLKDANSKTVDIGWFAEQGFHHSGMTYPALARKHLFGDEVPERDILGVALFLHNPKSDNELKRIIANWVKSDTNKSDQLFHAIGKLEEINIKNSFGNPMLGVAYNPTPLIDTGEWKEATTYRVGSKNG